MASKSTGFGGVRPRPDFSCKFVMCKRVKNCRFGESCTYAHSLEEVIAWNSDSSGVETLSSHKSTSIPLSRVQSSSDSLPIIREPLSAQNYKEKFVQLIESERAAHRGVLEERCKDKYKYKFLDSVCPDGVKIKGAGKYSLFGRLEGLKSEDIAYVKQASSLVTLLFQNNLEATADICYHEKKLKNMHHITLAFTESKKYLSSSSDMPVSVTFHLKESYFDSLIASVEQLKVIPRLFPDSFPQVVQNEELEDSKVYFNDEQFKAFKTIVNTPNSSPPVLLTGAFGTGKSRLLVLCALHFLTKSTKKAPVRILVCTQQRFSADKFLEYYNEKAPLWKLHRGTKVCMIRDYGFEHLEHEKKKFCLKSSQFKMDYEENSFKYQTLVIITTCLTAPHLKFLHPGFFSHIFIDEGSHMREPEAVAPLYFADKKTKLVIAGDTNQVGPANLVLGLEARANSLNVSLLQRLEKRYESHDECQIIAKLFDNYRCHPDILNLVGKLFYGSRLTWNKVTDIPSVHPNHRYPLVFICSGVEKVFSEKTQDLEAEIIVNKVINLAKQSPPTWQQKHSMKNFLVTSPCESQVSVITKKFWDNGISVLPEIKSVFQGQEYQAVILSTTEPVNEDGSTRDSTKSFCDPYVFNTAITRAKSLVVAIGNPFLLLKMEKAFIQKYGNEHNFHCWSTYMETCLENDSFIFDERLEVADSSKIIEEIKRGIAQSQKSELLESENLTLKQHITELQKKIEDLTEQNSMLLKENEELKKSIKSQSYLDQSIMTSDLSTETGIPVEASSTSGGSKMMVQDRLEYKFHTRHIEDDRNRHFVVKDCLGKGGFAKVYKVAEKGRDKVYALKIIPCDRVSDTILREVDALQKLQHHKRIVQYKSHWKRCANDEGWWKYEEGSKENQEYLFIMTELCSKETLCNWLEKTSGNNSRYRKIVCSYFGQIVEGLCFIHDNNLIHRDLKPSNILFSFDKDELKISDFGLAKDGSSFKASGTQSTNSSSVLSTFAGFGTDIYISPEQRHNPVVDNKTDIYALGLILFELFYPRDIQERQKKKKVFGEVTCGKYPDNFSTSFPAISCLISKMVEYESSKRLSVAEVQVSFNEVEETAGFIQLCDEPHSECV